MLKEVIISITNRCNLKCRMCDIPLARQAELDSSRWKRLISQARDAGASAIVFSGGEPLLREDLVDLVSYAKSLGLGCCLTTNGTLLTPDLARRLACAGVDVVNISIEGPAAVHDSLRGSGNYAKACAGLEYLRQAGIESTIAMMVCRDNFAHMDYPLRIAKDYGVTTVKYQPFSNLFLAGGNAAGKGFFLEPSQAQRLALKIEEVLALAKEKGLHINPVQYMRNIAGYLARGSVPGRKGCPALYTSCPVTGEGEVFPCWQLCRKEFLLGRLDQKDFLSIWDSRRRADILRRIAEHGCPGCMMSCYDEGFGARPLEERVGSKLKTIRMRGLPGALAALMKKWKGRLSFYLSYRGSWKGLWRRACGYFQRRSGRLSVAFPQQDDLCAEIAAARRLLEKELRR